jgi:hypothetical protein
MIEQWQELKETITELRDNDGTGTQQEVCKFLANYMEVLEKQMPEPFDIETYCKEHFCVMVDKDVWEKAEKALKQEPILDKIRDEIREFSVVDESGTYRISTYLVDQIIDKYRGEEDETDN